MGGGGLKKELSHLKIQIYRRLKRKLILIRQCERVHIVQCKHLFE